MLLAGTMSVLACLAMAQVKGAVSVPALAGLCFLLGLSTMGWNALYIALTAEVVPVHRAATAVGAGTTITFIGMFAVTPVFGAIADHTGSYAASWLALAGWSLLGTFIALAVRDRRSPIRRPAAGEVA
jgi:MFS family permease